MNVDFNSILNNSQQKSIWKSALRKILGLQVKAYQILTIDEDGNSTHNVLVTPNAKINLTDNVTLTLTNLTNGCEGNIIVTNALSDYSLAIVPTPYVINDGEGSTDITYGSDTVTILSYTYDGEELYITVGSNYTKVV